MKVYLCTSCGKSVPLKELAAHRQTCQSELALKDGTGPGWGGRVFRLLLAAGLTAAGIALGFTSFSAVSAMRQLERIPATDIHAVLPGEANLSGRAIKLDTLFKAPKTGTKCLYYRYVVKKKERDSDGDTRWRTVKDETKTANFYLEDKTGRIPVMVGGNVQFSLPESYETQSGGYKYIEWRIDPQDDVFVFGAVAGKDGAYEVRFDTAGYYDPIISKYSELSERADMAGASLLQCWGSLLLLAFAVGFAIRACGIHRLLVFFAILSAVIMINLTVQGIMMMVADLRAGSDRLASHRQAAQTLIQEELGKVGVKWDGDWPSLNAFATYGQLDDNTAARLKRIRLDLAVATTRVQSQRATFPENMVAALAGVKRHAELPLPDVGKQELAGLSATFQKAKISGMLGLGMIAGAILIGLPALIFGFRNVKQKRCMENVPTSKTTGAVFGLAEFKGVVVPAEDQVPLTSPLTKLPCSHYTYKIEEKRGSGKKAKWVTVLDESDRCRFLCGDAEGAIEIDPEGAEIMTCHKTSRREGRLRYTETRLEVNDPLYVIGACVVHPERQDQLHVRKPEDQLPFIISNMTELAVTRSIAGRGVAFLNVAFGSVLLIGLTLFGLLGSFGADDYLAAAMLAPTFMLFVMLVLHFNDLVFLRQRVNRNAANIDVSLKKRSDLLPNLEAIVKQYMGHEQGVLQAVTEMRSAYGKRQPGDAESIGDYVAAEHYATGQVIARMEAYPDLKASEEVRLLMRTMVALENEIALMREGYNHAVEVYNTRIATLPDLVFAKLFGFRASSFIQADGEVLVVPSLADSFVASAVAYEPDGGLVFDEKREACAQLYALLVNPEVDVRAKQIACVRSRHDDALAKRTAALVAELDAANLNDLQRLHQAEACYAALAGLSEESYRSFGIVVRELMEAEGVISLFESVLQYSLAARLAAARAGKKSSVTWYESAELVMKPIGVVLSKLVYAEADVEATAAGVFATGIAALRDEGGLAIEMLPREACGLPAFNLALLDLGRCSENVRKQILTACEACVADNDDFTVEQALLMAMIADALDLPRPEWVG